MSGGLGRHRLDTGERDRVVPLGCGDDGPKAVTSF
jgi:hypothetical protein